MAATHTLEAKVVIKSMEMRVRIVGIWRIATHPDLIEPQFDGATESVVCSETWILTVLNVETAKSMTVSQIMKLLLVLINKTEPSGHPATKMVWVMTFKKPFAFIRSFIGTN